MKVSWEKKLRPLKCTLFDAAVLPLVLIVYGIPALLIVAVLLLVGIGIALIIRAHKREKQRKGPGGQ